MEWKKIKKIYYLALLWGVCFSAGAQNVKVNNIYAIVVGISGYQDAAIPRLNYADKDAILFAQWLGTKTGGSLPQAHIKLLTNENATVAAFYNALDWAKHIAKENDVVYVYFSGHGDVETKNKMSQGYLLAWNSPPNNYLNNAISVSDLNNTANELTTKNKAKIVLITDACHSGKMAGDFYKGRQLTAANLMLVLNNQVRMASCREDEEAAEGKGWGGGRGVFSYYLLKGLQGAAKKNGLVKLKGLQHFLDSCFFADKELQQSKHIQHPVSDGSPLFTLAKIDPSTLASVSASTLSSSLQSLKSVGPQPMDYFFTVALKNDFENVLQFSDYLKDSPAKIAVKMVGDYCALLRKPIEVQDQVYKVDSLQKDSSFRINMAGYLKQSLTPNTITTLKGNYESRRQQTFQENLESHSTLNHLLILLTQLKINNYSRERFAERFVQLIHNKSQDMINAYVKGDAAELEKRQYYATGNRNYKAFLPLMKIAIAFAPENNYLKSILQVNEKYLDAVIDRLNISTNAVAADSLLSTASLKIQEAMRLEPYSAYIHNEMGNILFQKKRYDSASYHFNYASLLSPSWAIPYSNKIRVGLATDHLPAAISAAQTGDSLQTNLAFVHINAGLVMEKTGDLLAAESHYLRAIKENNVHYLPYERLGYLYLQACNYALADSFLYDAKVRKELFAVNEAPFKYGVAMAGSPSSLEVSYHFLCNSSNDSLLTGWQKYSKLIDAVEKVQSTKSVEYAKGIKTLTIIAKKNPDMIFANHYLGKQKFKNGDNDAAEILLKKAVNSYRDRESLKTYLKKILTASLDRNSTLKNIKNTTSQTKKINLIKQSVDSSCILNGLLDLNYNELEDHYLLADIYHKENRVKEEINEYNIISVIENKNQDQQAVMAGFYIPTANKKINRQLFFRYLFKNGLDEYRYQSKYFEVSTLGGAVKLARLLEQEKNYKAAESALLRQAAKNWSAGYLRQKKIKDSEFILPEEAGLNSYWRDLNENLQNETFHFYERMISIFPRDAYWYKNAGIFLYNRLRPSFSQLNAADRKGFYTISANTRYPFKLLMNGNKYAEGDRMVNFFQAGIKTTLPGTGENIKFNRTPYDPVSNANYFLQQGIKYSGEKLPSPTLTEYLADLQSWMGLNDSAIVNYKYALKYNPKNVGLLTKLSDVLRIEDLKPEIIANFEVLKNENKLSINQQFELTDFYMLQHHYKEAEALLNSLPENTASRKIQKCVLNIKFYLLQNEFVKALPFVIEALRQPYLPQSAKENLTYTKARIEAASKNNPEALKTLDKLFDPYYNWFYVLSRDEVLKDLRKEPGWKTLMQAHPFIDIYSRDVEKPVSVNDPNKE